MGELTVTINAKLDNILDVAKDIAKLQTYKLFEDDDMLLVERDDVVEVLKRHIKCDHAPTFFPDEVRGVGKWITKENGKVWWYECSCCGTRPLKSRWVNEETLSCYCPHCGAKMEVSE